MAGCPLWFYGISCRNNTEYMKLSHFVTLSALGSMLLACSSVQEFAALSGAAVPVEATHEANESLSVSGHLICTYTHCFFVPDAAGKAVLKTAGHPMADEEGVSMVSWPEPEAYFSFRSTYLPPMRSFMRVECADTSFEISYPWDEVCPVRVVAHLCADGKETYSDYAPADIAFLKEFAAQYNQDAKAGIYKGMAGTPTTEAMRGQALPADFTFGDLENQAFGPLSRRYIQAGQQALAQAEAAAERLDKQRKIKD